MRSSTLAEEHQPQSSVVVLLSARRVKDATFDAFPKVTFSLPSPGRPRISFQHATSFLGLSAYAANLISYTDLRLRFRSSRPKTVRDLPSSETAMMSWPQGLFHLTARPSL